MTKIFKANYIFNILLFFWCISTPFRNNLFTFLIIIFFIVTLIRDHDYKHLASIVTESRKLFLPFLFFIIAITISNLINQSSYPDIWIQEFKFIFRFPLLVLILMYLYSKSLFKKETLIIFILISLLLQSIDAIYQYTSGYDFFKHYAGNLCSGLTGANPNRALFGFLMATASIISFVLLINSNNKPRELLLLFIITSFLFGLIYSFTRGSWLAFSISLLLFCIASYEKIKLKHVYYLMFFAAFAAVLFSSSDCLTTRVEQLTTGESSGRFDLWLQALEYIKQKPIFGWGLHNSEAIHSLGSREFKYVHNSVLELLVKSGVAGFLAFTSIVIITIRELIIRSLLGLLSIFIFLMITSLFDHSIFVSNVFISVLSILIFFIYSPINKPKRQYTS